MIRKRIIKIVLVSLLVICFIPTSISNAKTLTQSIDELMRVFTIKTDKKISEVTSIEYKDKIYLSTEDISKVFDKKVVKDNNTINIIDDKVQEENIKIKNNFLLNGFYAYGSSDQFEEFSRSKTLSNFNVLSFGWSRIDKVGKKVELVFDKSEYRVPNGYDKTLKITEETSISSQLMVFVNDNNNRNDYFKDIFKDMDRITTDIANAVNGKNKEYTYLRFNGVTLDFENVNVEDQDQFIFFLKKLRVKLGKDKKIYVTLPSVKYYGYYKYKEIFNVVDYVILMEHDFDLKKTKSIYSDLSKSPLSPINAIKKDIETLINKVGDDNKNKILLQICFGTSQWIGDKDSFMTKYTPQYYKVYNRICYELDKKIPKEKLLYYNDLYKNPYLIYINDKKETNYIWYENWKSVLAKIKLANDYDLGGISLWKIGSIPNYYGKYGKVAGFDIWIKLCELLGR
jgi:spore germination protein YaaH